MSSFIESLIADGVFQNTISEELAIEVLTDCDIQPQIRRNLVEINEKLDEHLEKMSDYLANKLSVDGLNDISSYQATNEYVFGRVRADDTQTKQDALSLRMEGTSLSKRRPHIDLSSVHDYCLFPGQLIAVKGTNVNKDKVIINEIVDPRNFLRKASPLKINLQCIQSIQIATCSGHFISAENEDMEKLNKFIDYAIEFKPNIVVIFGPLVENRCKNDQLKSADLFAKVIDKIHTRLKNIENFHVLIVPSEQEFCHELIFPTPAYHYSFPEKSKTVIRFLANPCVIFVNGVKIGLLSTDIILHLSRQLIENYDNPMPGQRINNICEHLLAQQSFYPLYPPDPTVNLEFAYFKNILLKNTPHMMIIPSTLQHFSKSINGTVFVNPGRLFKNMFARVHIDSNGGEEIESIDKVTDVEICKLEFENRDTQSEIQSQP